MYLIEEKEGKREVVNLGPVGRWDAKSRDEVLQEKLTWRLPEKSDGITKSMFISKADPNGRAV